MFLRPTLFDYYIILYFLEACFLVFLKYNFLLGFFFLILIQKVAPKWYNLCSPRWTHLSLEEISGNGSELKISVDVGLERLRVICSWEGKQTKRVPVSRSQG